jgi:DNA-directed RNA polymerase specialized sigma54-like protein
MQARGRRARRLAHFLSDNDITRTEIAADLGQSTSNVSRKIRGTVPFTSWELIDLRCFLSRRVGRDVAWDEILDAEPVPTAVAPEHTGRVA